MKILVVDHFRESCSALADRLQERLRHPALCAMSPADAMLHIKKENDSIGVIVFFLDADPNVGLSFIREVLDYCEERIIKSPDFLIFPAFELFD